jgi:uncharacterized protein (DUF2384 family)
MPDLFPDENPDLRKEIESVIAEPGRWLEEPNSNLSGSRPSDLLQTPLEYLVRELIRRIKHGVIS